MPDKAFRSDVTRTTIPMKMHSSSPLRIRPPMARVPRRLAANPSQIPRTFSTGATNTTRRPLSPRSWKINQHPRKNVSGPRAPKSREKVATPFYRLVFLAQREVAQSQVAAIRPCRQSPAVGCHPLGRAWRTRGCYQNLRYFGVAATSHPQPFNTGCYVSIEVRERSGSSTGLHH